MQSGYVNSERIRAQALLPETADELCAVANSVRADNSNVLLGGQANEVLVKGLSEQGTLIGAPRPMIEPF